MKTKILILLLVFMLISCKQKEKQQIEIKSIQSEIGQPIVEQKSDDTISENQHCFVKEVVKEEEKYYIIADYVDFLTGDKAVERAKEYGVAEYDVSKSGDTTYFVYSDYYLSNLNPKLRTLELAEEVKIELLDFSENPNQSGYKVVSIIEFIEQIKNEPIIILKIRNGIVIEMKEQFTP